MPWYHFILAEFFFLSWHTFSKFKRVYRGRVKKGSTKKVAYWLIQAKKSIQNTCIVIDGRVQAWIAFDGKYHLVNDIMITPPGRKTLHSELRTWTRLVMYINMFVSVGLFIFAARKWPSGSSPFLDTACIGLSLPLWLHQTCCFRTETLGLYWGPSRKTRREIGFWKAHWRSGHVLSTHAFTHCTRAWFCSA